MRLPNELQAPRDARRALKVLGEEVPPDRLADVGLLVSELVTNCVRYAEGSPILLTVDLDGTGLHVEVSDHGPGIPSHDAAGVMPSPQLNRGRGLALVASVADRWGIAGGPGATVWFTVPVP